MMKKKKEPISETPFNPLGKKNLGESVAKEMLNQPIHQLPPEESFSGAGIYAIYYVGNFPVYKIVSDKNKNKDNPFSSPIYVGKAVPEGARKGGFGLDIPPGTVLYKRLREHAKSIEQAKNLSVDDFHCRYLVVDDIWIPLAESLLIEMFSTIWNKIVDGFGIHDPGSGRHQQQKSAWDVLHPGRAFAGRLTKNIKSEVQIIASIQRFYSDNMEFGEHNT